MNKGSEKHLSKNQVTILLKRFSAKDEKRRLTGGVFIPDQSQGFFVGFENHLNCITKKGSNFDLNEAFGLAGLFNSSLIDKYFRCISGNTQVNATEIREMKMPDREIIKNIGRKLRNNFKNIDEVIKIEVEKNTKVA